MDAPMTPPPQITTRIDQSLGLLSQEIADDLEQDASAECNTNDLAPTEEAALIRSASPLNSARARSISCCEWVITSLTPTRAPRSSAVYLPSDPLLTIATAWFTASSTP